LDWFEQILPVAQILDILTMRDQTNEYQNKALSDLVKEVWPKTQENTSFTNVDAAIKAMLEESKFNTSECDEELVRYAEQRTMDSPSFLASVCFSAFPCLNLLGRLFLLYFRLHFAMSLK
jgi:hypothetical protein